jgi:hypothetical protein
MSDRAIALILAVLLGIGIGAGIAQADNGSATSPTQSDLVNQANAPISGLFQVRLQDAYAPAFQGQLHGQGNLFSIAVGMPVPQYRVLPFPQLSLLTIPAAVTLPLPLGSLTGFGDIRFLDIAVIDAGHSLLFGVGPTFVFPTASDLTSGQGKWQAGPAAAVAFAPRKWLLGILAPGTSRTMDQLHGMQSRLDSRCCILISGARERHASSWNRSVLAVTRLIQERNLTFGGNTREPDDHR